MRTKLFLALLFSLLAISTVNSQTNLKKMYRFQRNKILINQAKELTKEFGLKYYCLIKGKPEISKIKKFVAENDDRIEIQRNNNREFYEISFPYDTTKVHLEWNFASKVSIWSDTGTPMGLIFGNGMGVNFLFNTVEDVKNEKIKILIQETTVRNLDLNSD